MFGCLAIYVDGRLMLILRDKPAHAADNGVWLATMHAHHDSLRREFPSMRSIALLGKSITGWQVLPADADDFEQAALHACELVMSHDPRIGKIPEPRRSRAKKKSASPQNSGGQQKKAKARSKPKR